jgi:hypothetical protein
MMQHAYSVTNAAASPTHAAPRKIPSLRPLTSVYHPEGTDTRSWVIPRTAVEYPTSGELRVSRNTKLARTDWLHTDRPANAKNVYTRHRRMFGDNNVVLDVSADADDVAWLSS